MSPFLDKFPINSKEDLTIIPEGQLIVHIFVQVSLDLRDAVALSVVAATVMQHALLQSSGILGKVQNTAEPFLRRMNLLVKLSIHYIPEKYL